ncbi:MAG: hypothetical protein K6G51_06205 [Sphaerochaetaceae bacterium]|nr:hypothetical protein [Sphaerochaetaceae bacterium]
MEFKRKTSSLFSITLVVLVISLLVFSTSCVATTTESPKAEAVVEESPKAEVVAEESGKVEPVSVAPEKQAKSFSFVRTEEIFGNKLTFKAENELLVVEYPAEIQDYEVFDFFVVKGSKYDTTGIEIIDIDNGKLAVSYPDAFEAKDVNAVIDLLMVELKAYVEELYAQYTSNMFSFEREERFFGEKLKFEAETGLTKVFYPDYIPASNIYDFVIAKLAVYLDQIDCVHVINVAPGLVEVAYPFFFTAEDVDTAIDLIMVELNDYVGALVAAEQAKAFNIVRTESIMGRELAFNAVRGMCLVGYPEELTDNDIVTFLNDRVAAVAGEIEGLQIGKVGDNVLLVIYPKDLTADDVNAAIDYLVAEIKSYVGL